ncbi:MAG: hypothetical protein GY936_00945 [Ignavibacteriae bacterium]|nr:hypothetical protein [Ignavibacteriota bacterium]
MKNEINIERYLFEYWIILFIIISYGGKSFANSNKIDFHINKSPVNYFEDASQHLEIQREIETTILSEFKNDTTKTLPKSTNEIKPKVTKTTSKNNNYILSWEKISGSEEYQLIIETINESAIFGKTYNKIIDIEVFSTNYTFNDSLLTNVNEYRWKVRAKVKNEWTLYSNYSIERVIEDEKIEENLIQAIDDIYFNLKYFGILNEIIIAKFNDDKVYLPILELLSMLQINHNVEIDEKIISGKVSLDSQEEFEINFEKSIFTNYKSNNIIEKDDFIETELEYYLTPKLIDEILGLNLKVDFRRLHIKVRSTNTPIYERLINEKELSVYQNSQISKSYPLLFGRERKLFNGLLVNYSLSGNYTKNQNSLYSYQLGVGAEILGGDFQFFNSQSYIKNKFQYSKTDARWRYAFLKNNYLSSVTFGNNNATGLLQYQFNGIQVSNIPLEERKLYGNYKIEEQTNPNWTVEIYRDNQLIDIVKANSDGEFGFRIPFVYGTTLIELHMFGTNGEFELIRKMYQIPFNQVPQGRLDYTLNFGQLISNEQKIFQGSASYGISNWLTTTLGSDIFVDEIESSSIYNITTARISEGHIFDIKIADNALIGANLNSVFSNLANVNIGAKFYDENAKLNPTNINNELSANIFYPLQIANTSLSLIARGKKTKYEDSERADFSLRSFLTYKNISPSLEYKHFSYSTTSRSIKSDYLNLRLGYSFSLPVDFLTGNLFSSQFGYNYSNNKLEYFNVAFSTTLFRKFRVYVTHTNNLLHSNYNTQIRVSYNLPFLRSNTTFSGSSFSQSVDGSINYIQGINEFDFNNMGMIGKSGVAFNAYLDENYNNEFDENEKIIKDIDVKIKPFGNKKISRNGTALVNNLDIYSTHNVKLIGGASNNPEWKPVYDKFSFITDPNQFKVLNIPFYEASEIYGNVNRIFDERKVAVSGITIIVKNISTQKTKKIQTLSDGSFYYFGLQPGLHDIYIEKADLEKLKVKSNPKIMEVYIESITSDIENEEFEFLLEDKKEK